MNHTNNPAHEGGEDGELAELGESLQRLRDSIAWLRDGLPRKSGIGVADMVVLERALSSRTQPAAASAAVSQQDVDVLNATIQRLMRQRDKAVAASAAVPEGWKLVSGEAYGQRYVSVVEDKPAGKIIVNAYEQGAPAMFAFLSSLAAAPRAHEAAHGPSLAELTERFEGYDKPEVAGRVSRPAHEGGDAIEPIDLNVERLAEALNGETYTIPRTLGREEVRAFIIAAAPDVPPAEVARAAPVDALRKLALNAWNLAFLCDGSAGQVAAARAERDRLMAAIDTKSLVRATPEVEAKPLTAAVADALRPYLGEGQKVIWREAFRWKDDNGVLPNHFEMLSLAQLAATFGYTVAVDCGCAGIIGTHPEADREQENG